MVKLPRYSTTYCGAPGDKVLHLNAVVATVTIAPAGNVESLNGLGKHLLALVGVQSRNTVGEAAACTAT